MYSMYCLQLHQYLMSYGIAQFLLTVSRQFKQKHSYRKKNVTIFYNVRGLINSCVIWLFHGLHFSCHFEVH